MLVYHMAKVDKCWTPVYKERSVFMLWIVTMFVSIRQQ